MKYVHTMLFNLSHGQGVCSSLLHMYNFICILGRWNKWYWIVLLRCVRKEEYGYRRLRVI